MVKSYKKKEICSNVSPIYRSSFIFNIFNMQECRSADNSSASKL